MRRPAPTARQVRALANRLIVAVFLLVLLSLVVYVGVDLLPGDPVTARLGQAGPARVAEVRAGLGLDRPLATRYLDWAAGLLRGDLGTSATGRPVAEMLSARLGNSMLPAAITVVLMVPSSLALGVTAGLFRGRPADRILSTALLLVVSVPEFVLAGGLVLVFAAGLRWLPAVSLVPAGGNPLDTPAVLVLPVTALLLLALGYAGRIIRAATAAALRAPHVEFLRLNGIPPRAVLARAVLPAVLPVAFQVWLTTAVGLVGGAVLVEKVFAYPGIGEVLITAVQTGDLPVVQALAMILGAAMLVALLLADLGTRAMVPSLRTAPR
ncbi:peptide/nickel transport system permease protein [Thermocatellispora tengchongensis]|uniref:Peptide/nickel transport system permease protein n=1 Tax=Thermocatellispora tengchongensis TaxID=1073253 RepID=A0A840PHN3_9ACTN|nr:ABC transporter permease [Thermocatellispora tengchongensis]MBB5136637.1 peptide/nickel transport system permease protein [Thermocatellispora tengchongensis]